MIPVDLLGIIRKALKVSDSVLTFRPAILTFQGTKVQNSSQMGIGNEAWFLTTYRQVISPEFCIFDNIVNEDNNDEK